VIERPLRAQLRAFEGTSQALWRFVRPHLASEDVGTRQQAIQALARVDEPGALLPHLLTALRNEDDATLRNAAIEVLQRLGPQVVPLLLEQLDAADTETQKFLVDILGMIGSPVAVPRLARLMATAEPNLRFAILEALGKMGTPRACDTLVDLMAGIDGGQEAFALLTALTQCAANGALADLPLTRLYPFRDDPLLLQPLLTLLETIGSDEAQQLVWRMLSSVDDLTAPQVARYLGAQDPSALAERVKQLGPLALSLKPRTVAGMLRSIEPQVQNGAVWMAAFLPPDRELARTLLHRNLNEQHVAAAARYLDPDVVAQLAQEVRRGDLEEIRRFLCLAGQAGATAVADEVLGLGETYPELRAEAFHAGGLLGQIEVLRWLVDLLRDEAAFEFLAQGLQGLLPEHRQELFAVLQPWSEHLQDNTEWQMFLALVERLDLVDLRDRVELAWRRAEPELRARALRVLARFRLSDARRFLSYALTDGDLSVRLSAAEILVDIADNNDIDGLELLTADTEPWLRAEGLMALTRLQGPRMQTRLQHALTDAAPIVRIRALRELNAMGMGDPAAIGRLTRDVDHDVAALAIEVLRRRGVAPGSRDEHLLHHPHWRVRVAAVVWFVALSPHADALAQCREREEDPDVRAAFMKRNAQPG